MKRKQQQQQNNKKQKVSHELFPGSEGRSRHQTHTSDGCFNPEEPGTLLCTGQKVSDVDA